MPDEVASVAELRSAFPDNPTFALACAEAKLSLKDAKVKAFDENLAPEKTVRGVGVAAVRSGRPAMREEEGEEYTGDAIKDFDAAVRKEIATAKCDRRTAVRNVAQRDRDLHRAYLEATNAKGGRRVQNLIAEKFE